jgi:hypothetical protein
MNSRQLVGGKALRIEPLCLLGILQQRSRAIVTHTLANTRERSIQPDGNASFVASNPFTLLFLAQDGSNRLVGGVRLQELQVDYGMDILPLDVGITTTFLVPTALTVSLFEAHAGIDVGASGSAVTGDVRVGRVCRDGHQLSSS